MRTFDGRRYINENNNIKCVTPNDGIATNFKVFDKRIFLAGPITGAPDWQSEMVSELVKLNQDDLYSTLICNTRRDKYDETFNSEYQIHWDQTHIQNCNIILFYIPEPVDTKLKDRYAKTTMYELAEMLHTNKYKNPDNKIIIAIHPKYSMYKYVEERILRMENIEKKNITFLTGITFSGDCIKQVAAMVME